MCCQAVHQFVHGFGFCWLKPPGRDEYPPSGATVLAVFGLFWCCFSVKVMWFLESIRVYPIGCPVDIKLTRILGMAEF